MSFFSLTGSEGSPCSQDELSFYELNMNSDAGMMFQNSFNQSVLSSRKLYNKNTSSIDIKMNEILLGDYFKYETMPLPIYNVANSPKYERLSVLHQASSPTPSTVASTPQKVQTPRSVLKKRRAYDFDDSDYSVESEEDSEEDDDEKEEEEFNRRKITIKITQEEILDSPPQDGQNKMKNHQGSIAARMKKFCRKDQENTRIFDEATRNLSDEKREAFRKWASTYHKNQKTWNTMKKFLSSHKEYGVIFVDMAVLFLSEAFENEFEEWLSQSQMSLQTKALLREEKSKDFYISKFYLTLDEIKGRVSDFRNEIKKPRKYIKAV